MAGRPLGLIAGSGALPVRIAQAAQGAQGTQEAKVFVVALENEADAALTNYPHIRCSLGHMKAAADALLDAGCEEIVLIGGIQRPKLDTLDLDEGGQWFMAQIAADEHRGDDQLLKAIIAYFQLRGLRVQPAQHYLGALTGKAGSQTTHAYAPHQADINRAIEVARVIGGEDIGQSVVVGRRLVLGIEGPEGTDAMLTRLQGLSQEFLGTADALCGVLAKLPKPQQDRRVDLPTLGQRTVELAASAHLAGIVFEAGGALFDDFEAVCAQAEAKGLFLLGLEAADNV